MSISLFINFNGNCKEAVEFYADVFGVEKQNIMTFKDAPPSPDFQIPDEAKDMIMYTFLNIGGNNIMFSDTFPGSPVTVGDNISITIGDTDIEKIKSYFNKMKEGGTVTMDLQETFWSKCYGSVTDKFGIPWQFSHDSGMQF